jgi:hypothetical protein
VRSLRKQGSRLIGRAARAAFAVLPDTPRHRRLLDGGGIPFATAEGQLVLIGDEAVEYARLFREPVRSVLEAGRLPRENPLARQVLATVIEAVLPRASQPDEVCCLTLPGGAVAGSHAAEFLIRLVRLAGYTPVVTRAGMALVLAELERSSFSGVGMTLGAATCELTVAHRGRELASVCLSRGGEWIDAQLAQQEGCWTWDADGQRRLDVEAVSRWKCDSSEPLAQASTPRAQALAAAYVVLVDALCAEAARVFDQVPAVGTLPRPLELIVGGGAALIPGFAGLLDERLRDAPLPAFAPARVVCDTEYAIARGCLIRAELESGTMAGRAAA